MKLSFLKFSFALSLLALGIVAISTPSCKKEKVCIGEITVYDSTGLPLMGARVQLTDTSRTVPITAGQKLLYEGKTDVHGYIKFEIQLPAVYPIRVQHPKILNKYRFGVLILNEPGSKDSRIIRF